MFEDDITDEEVARIQANEKKRDDYATKHGYPEDSTLDDLVWRYASTRGLHYQLGEGKAPISLIETSLERVAKVRGWAIRFLKDHPEQWPGFDRMLRSVEMIDDYWSGRETCDTCTLDDVDRSSVLSMSKSCLAKTAIYAEFMPYSPTGDCDGQMEDLLREKVQDATEAVDAVDATVEDF